MIFMVVKGVNVVILDINLYFLLLQFQFQWDTLFWFLVELGDWGRVLTLQREGYGWVMTKGVILSSYSRAAAVFPIPSPYLFWILMCSLVQMGVGRKKGNRGSYLMLMVHKWYCNFHIHNHSMWMVLVIFYETN